MIHTTEAKVATLAALEAAAGNIHEASRITGVPRPTIRYWRDRALAAQREATLVAPEKDNSWAYIYGEAARMGGQMIKQQLSLRLTPEGEPIRPIPAKDLRDLAIVAGIAADKHLDYRDGRRGAQVQLTQDNRTLTIILPQDVE